MSDVGPAAEGWDRCFRCGYDLRGIADDHPCPECGLLAERSRRKTDHLADAPPGWLRTVSGGLWVITLAALLGAGWAVIGLWALRSIRGTAYSRNGWSLDVHTELGVFTAAAIVLPIGVWLFTRPERADEPHADTIRRTWLRFFSCLPVVAMALLHALAMQPVQSWYSIRAPINHFWSTRVGMPAPRGDEWPVIGCALLIIPLYIFWACWRGRTPRQILLICALSLAGIIATAWTVAFYFMQLNWTIAGWINGGSVRMPVSPPEATDVALALLREFGAWIIGGLLTVGCLPLPVLLFYHLRSMARRVLNSRLAEHCAIVGFGSSTMLLMLPLGLVLFAVADRVVGEAWGRNSVGSALLLVTFFSFGIVFAGWSMLTLIRGARAFSNAAKLRRRQWAAADRSTTN